MTRTAAITADLSVEQAYYDRAHEFREAHRHAISSTPNSAASPKDAAEIKRAAERAVDAMPQPGDGVFFGRLDLEASGSRPARALYLGLMSVLDERKQVLVCEWQRPAVAGFYKASVANPMGVVSKREFEVSKHRITDFHDTVFSQLAEDLAVLEQGRLSDSLLADLEARRDENMRQIARTIGAAQYDLISSPLEQVLVIQGGPGTGKTAVALHRISYWLYNAQGALSAQDVLVVGPNSAFNRYISRVLPSLGDNGVASVDLRSLGPQTSDRREEPIQVARLKGTAKMAAVLRRALWGRVRVPAGADPLLVGPSGNRVTIDRDVLAAQLEQLQALPYRTGRDGLRAWLSQQAPRASADQVATLLERIWPGPSAPQFVQNLLGSRLMLLEAAGDDLSGAEISQLFRPGTVRLTEERWSDADVALIDEVESLLGGTAAQTYKHIVVDEAQDLSDMQLRSISRRSATGSYTVVGDLAQSTGPHARSHWVQVIVSLEREHPGNVVNLELGYRVPRQVMDLAAQLLPYAAPGVPAPRVIRDGPEDPDIVKVDSAQIGPTVAAAARGHAGRGDFVGIVCPDSLRDEVAAALQDDQIKWTDARDGLSTSINLVDPFTAKGLEFDAVVVVEPSAIADSDEQGLRLVYIAMTRTTARLTVVHTQGALPVPGTPTPTDSGEDIIPQPAVTATVKTARSADPKASDEAEVHPQLGPDVPIRRPPTATSFAERMVDFAVDQLEQEIREGLPPEAWLRAIDRLRRRLDISDDDLFDTM